MRRSFGAYLGALAPLISRIGSFTGVQPDGLCHEDIADCIGRNFGRCRCGLPCPAHRRPKVGARRCQDDARRSFQVSGRYAQSAVVGKRNTRPPPEALVPRPARGLLRFTQPHSRHHVPSAPFPAQDFSAHDSQISCRDLHVLALRANCEEAARPRAQIGLVVTYGTA